MTVTSQSSGGGVNVVASKHQRHQFCVRAAAVKLKQRGRETLWFEGAPRDKNVTTVTSETGRLSSTHFLSNSEGDDKVTTFILRGKRTRAARMGSDLKVARCRLSEEMISLRGGCFVKLREGKYVISCYCGTLAKECE